MTSGLIAWSSPDGIHWKKMRDEAMLTKPMVPFPYMFDSQNLAFWSAAEEKYLCYFRVFEDGIRRICRSTSDDFLNWDEPVLMEYEQNGKPAPIEHLYTNQTHPYFRAPHIYIATAARFMPGRQVLTEEQAKAINVNPKYFKDTSDAVLMTTRGGSVYQRTFLSGFVRPGIGATKLGVANELPRVEHRANRPDGDVALRQSGLRPADGPPASLLDAARRFCLRASGVCGR
jgi:hypothetical protein